MYSPWSRWSFTITATALPKLAWSLPMIATRFAVLSSIDPATVYLKTQSTFFSAFLNSNLSEEPKSHDYYILLVFTKSVPILPQHTTFSPLKRHSVEKLIYQSFLSFCFFMLILLFISLYFCRKMVPSSQSSKLLDTKIRCLTFVCSWLFLLLSSCFSTFYLLK